MMINNNYVASGLVVALHRQWPSTQNRWCRGNGYSFFWSCSKQINLVMICAFLREQKWTKDTYKVDRGTWIRQAALVRLSTELNHRSSFIIIVHVFCMIIKCNKRILSCMSTCMHILYFQDHSIHLREFMLGTVPCLKSKGMDDTHTKFRMNICI